LSSSDAAAFTGAASALISSYIPPADFSTMSISVSSAAAAASVTGDASSLIYSAFEATSLPAWFQSAIPASYSSQVAALTAAIGSLRPGASGTVSQGLPTPTISQTIVVATTTDSAGHTITTSFTSAAPIAGNATAGSGSSSSSTSKGGAAGPTAVACPVAAAVGVAAMVGWVVL
jgi:hypothetical protein